MADFTTSVKDPGSLYRIQIFFHPGSRIRPKIEEEKKIVVIPNYLIFLQVQKKDSSQLTQNLRIFTSKIVPQIWGWIWNPGKTYPG